MVPRREHPRTSPPSHSFVTCRIVLEETNLLASSLSTAPPLPVYNLCAYSKHPLTEPKSQASLKRLRAFLSSFLYPAAPQQNLSASCNFISAWIDGEGRFIISFISLASSSSATSTLREMRSNTSSFTPQSVSTFSAPLSNVTFNVEALPYQVFNASWHGPRSSKSNSKQVEKSSCIAFHAWVASC